MMSKVTNSEFTPVLHCSISILFNTHTHLCQVTVFQVDRGDDDRVIWSASHLFQIVSQRQEATFS